MSTPWLISYVALWLIVTLQLVAILVLARQLGVLHMRLPAIGARTTGDGPEVGELLPEMMRPGVDGHDAQIGSADGRRTLLVSVAPGCQVCGRLAPALRSLARSESSTLRLILISLESSENANREFRRRHGLERVSIVTSAESRDALRIHMAPYAVLADEQGIVRAKGIVNSLEQLESLFNAADFDDGVAEVTGAAL